MNDLVLVLARPAAPVDCLPPALEALVSPDCWVAWLSVDGAYLEDLNDDPIGEDAYEAGAARWPACVAAVLGALLDPFPDSAYQRTLTEGRSETVPVGAGPLVDDDEIAGLSTYGGVATLWSADPELGWWVAHGYKEAYLVGRTPRIELGDLVTPVAERLGLPVSVSGAAFVPHRVRMQS